MTASLPEKEGIMRKERDSFTCAQAQSKLTAYIHDGLSLKETEKFIQHISSCSECREELGVYYTILTGMEKLNDDEDISMDFTEELKRKLKRSEEKILHSKRNAVLRRILFFLLAIGWLFLDFQRSVRKEPENSNFKLEEYFFEGRHSQVDEYARAHYNAMMGDKNRYYYGNRD